MSEERDWAEFYEQHRGDPDMWGEREESTPPAPKGGLSATITVRFSPEEASAIRGLARETGVSYSDIVRTAVRKFVYVHLAVGDAEQSEPEDRHDFSTNTSTSTGSLALLHHR